MSILHTGEPFLGRSSPVVARTPPQTRKGRCSVAEQSFGMCNICIHRIVFELCVTEEEEQEQEQEKEQEQEERRRTKLTFSRLVFSALLKVSGTYRVDLAIE